LNSGDTIDPTRTEVWLLDLAEQRAECIARETVGDDEIAEAIGRGVRYLMATRDPAFGVIATAISKEELRFLAASRYDARDVKLHVVRGSWWRNVIRRFLRRISGGAE
jgi:hypothetical protein